MAALATAPPSLPRQTCHWPITRTCRPLPRLWSWGTKEMIYTNNTLRHVGPLQITDSLPFLARITSESCLPRPTIPSMASFHSPHNFGKSTSLLSLPWLLPPGNRTPRQATLRHCQNNDTPSRHPPPPGRRTISPSSPSHNGSGSADNLSKSRTLNSLSRTRSG